MIDFEKVFDLKYFIGLGDGETIAYEGEASLVTIFQHLGYKTGAEIGVFEGHCSEHLCKSLEGPIYCIDPWKSIPHHIYHEKNPINNLSQEDMDERYEGVKKRLKPYPQAVILRKESVEALSDIKNESLDFVYIDANHNPHFIWHDIRGWWRKVRKGGILSGHDINKPDIRREVEYFVKEKKLNKFYEAGIYDWFIFKQ